MDSQSNKSDNFQAGRWSDEQQHKFIVGVMNFGKDWKQVQEVVKTRNGSQVRSHAQKFFLKISKILKMRKKLAKKGKKYVLSEIEEEFVGRINKQWITQQTPQQIISLLDQSDEILKESKQKNKSNDKKKVQKQSSQNEPKQEHNSSAFRFIESQQRAVDISQTQQLREIADFKIFRNMTGSNMEQSYQQQSYFMHVMQRYFRQRRLNMDPLSTGYDFSGFIDFSKPLTNTEGSNQNRRKRSFHLVGQQDNEQKLKRTLENFRNLRQQ